MKIFKMVSCALIFGAMVLTGCGNDDPTPNGSVPSASNAAPIAPTNPIYGAGATMPVGCYYTGTTNCSPCPVGYTQNGTYCQLTNGFNGNGCPAGTIWTGNACQPSGYAGCPNGTNYMQGGACMYSGYSQPYYNNYVCYPVYLNGYYTARCYYTNGAPNGYYYNGYGYYRF